MRRLLTLVSLTLATALLAPASALAGASEDFLEVYKTYQATGSVDGCRFSAKKLASAKRGVPPDVDTYAPDFPDALDAALRSRAGGDCEKAGAKQSSTGANATTSAGTFAASDGTASRSGPGSSSAGGSASGRGATGPTGAAAAAGAPPTTTPAPAPEIAAGAGVADGAVAAAASRNAGDSTSADVPFPLMFLAVLLALAALAGLLWALARYFAYDPPWLASSRHATAEAGWRASASWAEFTDWVRLGR